MPARATTARETTTVSVICVGSGKTSNPKWLKGNGPSHSRAPAQALWIGWSLAPHRYFAVVLAEIGTVQMEFFTLSRHLKNARSGEGAPCPIQGLVSWISSVGLLSVLQVRQEG